MIEGNGTRWLAALTGAVLATSALWGCAGSIVNAPADAAVSDVVVIDTPAAIDAPDIDTPPTVDAPGVDTPPVIDAPLTCDAGTILCGASCVNTATDASHCGACNRACETGWSCVTGTCACAAGQHPVGTVCAADDAPRPLAPISLGDVTQRRPTLRWALPPGIDGAVVELCRDRACMSVIETLRVAGESARPAADLPARSTVFWRMRGRAGSVERSGASPTWIFHVPATSASTTVDTSFNPHFDMNGDGFDDVVVGAREARPGVDHRVGTASVYYGSATWTQPPAGTARTPDRLLEGGAANGGYDFDFSVAGAGDINGDGYADLVVGTASTNPDGRSRTGTARVFYGSATWTRPAAGTARTPDRLFEEAATDDGYGFPVAGAGDVNGDGYSDLVVGVRMASPGGRELAGKVSVYYGSATWTQPAAGTASTPDRLLEGPVADDGFGYLLAGAGDVNGDGYSDLVVWSSIAVPGARDSASTASVYYGSATWTQPAAGTPRTPDRLIQGAAGGTTNPSLESAGDVNGDGYADLVIGTAFADLGGRMQAGRAAVYYGSATWTQPPAGTMTTPDRFLEGAIAGDWFGNWVGSAGDVNGDGYGDLVIGAPSASSGGRRGVGTASVFYGSASWTQPAAGTARTPDRLLEGAAADEGFGWRVAGAGDVNGDGYADLVVGAYHADPGGRSAAGTASVYYGSAMWTQPAAGVAHTPDRLLEGVAVGDWFGVVVATADDSNRHVSHGADLLAGGLLAALRGRSFASTALTPVGQRQGLGGVIRGQWTDPRALQFDPHLAVPGALGPRPAG
jgi:hypothetical protein